MTEPITPPIQEPKLDLKREETKDLRIFFFIARKPEIKAEEERCLAVLAYDLENALIRATQEAKGLGLVFHGQSTTVKELIEKIYLEGVVSPPTAEAQIIEPLPEPEMKKQQFIHSLLLVADKFLDKEKAEQLKEILKSIKVGKKD